MRKFNFENSEDFKKLRESIISEMNTRYEKLVLTETLNSLDTAPFFKTKHIFEAISKGLYDNAKGKSTIKEYINTIKSNKSLKKAFMIYENINRPQSVLSPELFVNENLSFASQISLKEYAEGLKKLNKIVKESIIAVGLSSDELKKLISESENDTAKAVDFLINNRKSLKNITEYTNNVSILSESVKEKNSLANKDNTADGQKISDLISCINESITGLKREEAEAIKELTLSSLAGRDEREVYEAYRQKCEELLNEAVETEETAEGRSRFQKMLEQVKNKNYNETMLNEDILNFARLYATLKENE